MKKTYTIFIILGYVWFSLVLLYIAVFPPTIKEQIDLKINETFAALTAIGAGGISTLLVYFKGFTQKERKINLDTMLDFGKNLKDSQVLNSELFDKVFKQLENYNNKTEKLFQEQTIKNEIEQKNNSKLVEIERLIKVELESKLTNPFLDEDIATKIKEVLGDEKE